MNTRRTPATKKEGRVANKRIPLRGEKFPIENQEDVNKMVPPEVRHVPQVPQGPSSSQCLNGYV